MKLELKEISFGFNKDHQLFNNLNLTIEEGDVYGLTGDNGSGKTTLLNIISGFIKPTKGVILVNETPIKKKKPFQLNRAGICRTFQDLRLAANLTVRQNILLSMRSNPTDKWFNALLPASFFFRQLKDHNTTTDQILQTFFLKEVENSFANQISYGQQKLLNLACCFANGAQILLLDEPVAGINNEFKSQITQIIDNLKTQKKSILLIEHDVSFIKNTANRFGNLKDGMLSEHQAPISAYKPHYLTRVKGEKKEGINTESLLKIQHLNAGYGKRQVLYDLSIDIHRGDITLLTGGNGSGKSTLLKAIFGVLNSMPYDKGRIEFDCFDITGSKPHQLVQKGLVYVPQKNNIFENLTVEESLEVAINNILSKTDRTLQIKKVFDYLPQLAILKRRKPFNMSGGERQLLALGMALMHKPKMIMLDEPGTGLSANNFQKKIEILRKLNKEQITLLIVEHKVDAFAGLADQVIQLHLGKIS